MTFSFIKEKRDIPIALWFLLPALAGYAKWVRGAVNNDYIYKGVFHHLVKQVNLYSQYPQEYFDANHYGVVFGLIIMPFTWLPDGIGVPLWVALQAFVMPETSLSATDLFLPDVRRMFIIYSIKAVPCCVAWFVCIFQLLFDTTSQKMTLWLNQD